MMSYGCLAAIQYDHTAGETKAATEWIFILWQLQNQTALFSLLFYVPFTNNPNVTSTAVLSLRC